MSAEKKPDLRRLAERVLRIEADAILGLIPGSTSASSARSSSCAAAAGA